MVELRKDQPFFEYPFYDEDVQIGIKIAFEEFRRLNPTVSMFDDDIIFKFEKA
jgi:hypothetical protein